MNQRTTFDQIYDSLTDGQFKQMVAQMDELGGDDKAELITYVADNLADPEASLKICIVYFRAQS